MNASILQIIEKIKSIFGDSIFYENNRRQLISAVKDFAEDFEDEEFLENAINSDDYKNGKSCLLKDEFYEKGDKDNEISPNTEKGNAVSNILYKLGMEFYKNDNYEIAEKYFIESAKKGNKIAQSYLTDIYYFGRGKIKRSLGKAFFWVRKSAEQGDKDAQKILGDFFHDGKGVGWNDIQAIYWMEKSAEQNNEEAKNFITNFYNNHIICKGSATPNDMYRLGVRYKYGEGIKQNTEKAYYWFELAAGLGHEEAKNLVSNRKTDNELASSESENIKLDKLNANINELYKIGMNYYDKEKYENAVLYLGISAKLGNLDAQSQLAICFYYGEGIEQDYKKAVFWLEKAASRGNARAMRNLAICYMNGKGVNTDYTQSFYWCKKAAMKEDAEAQFLLAQHYSGGFGTNTDFLKAIYWAEKAAANQDEPAKNSLIKIYKSIEQTDLSDFEFGTSDEMFELAISYCAGLDGITLDIDKAIFWFKKSDENGNDGIAGLCYMLFSNVKNLNYNSKLLGLAYFTIGSRYQFGDGVKQDEDKAIKFFVEAAKNGDQEAINILKNLGLNI